MLFFRAQSTKAYLPNMVVKRTQQVAPNNVAICCAEMLRSFGRGLQILAQQCCDVLRWDVAIVWSEHVECVWPPCCNVLQHVGCCWLKFENGQIFHATFVHVAWCCGRLARFVQQWCVWACALVRFSTRNKSQHVATGRPNASNMLRPTILSKMSNVCLWWSCT